MQHYLHAMRYYGAIVSTSTGYLVASALHPRQEEALSTEAAIPQQWTCDVAALNLLLSLHISEAKVRTRLRTPSRCFVHGPRLLTIVLEPAVVDGTRSDPAHAALPNQSICGPP